MNLKTNEYLFTNFVFNYKSTPDGKWLGKYSIYYNLAAAY